MFHKFFLVQIFVHGLWNLLVYHIAQIHIHLNIDMILLDRYVGDRLRPSNGYVNQNIRKKLKVFFKLFKNHTIPTFFTE